jgi:hypothetical protein
MGIRALTRIEIGRETTAAGTPIAADVLLQAEGMARDAQERAFPFDGNEFLFPIGRSYIRKEGVEITIDDSPVTSEQFGHILGMGICGGVTKADDATGSAKIYVYPYPTTAANTTVDTYTIEGGDDQESGEASYCFATRIGLKWAAGEELQFNADIVGRQWTDCAFTGTNPSASLHHITTAKLYIDATGATGFNTQKTQTFMGFELDNPTAWMPVYSGDGALYYTFPKYVGQKEGYEITGTLTLEHDATGEAELNFARAGTIRLVKVVFEGDNCQTGGTTYSKHSVVWCGAIQYTEVPALEDNDGNNIVALPFKVIYSIADDTAVKTGPTATGAGGYVVVNELDALP